LPPPSGATGDAIAAAPAAPTPKVFIKTFGCQMNVYDSGKMADVLREAAGYEPTDDVEQADLILFNTCSVREKAEEKVFSDLGRVKHLKDRGALIGVGGCVASQEGAAIVRRAPYVDLVFGPQTLHRLPAMLERRRAERRPQVDISFPEIEKFDHLPPARVVGPTAFVSIMEGCSKYCSYCVVPYTRGEEVSRPFDDVLVEIAGLAERGVREVTLLGQNVNAYRGAMGGTGGIADFATLLESVAEIPGVERIRYTTSHPKEFTQRLVDAHGRIAKLVDHVHLPVQHGSDRILAAMKRGYTSLEFKSTIRKLRAVRPQIAVSSDFIVGFPGETAEDFERTMQLVEDVGFDHSFSFLFSPRPGTPAASLADATSPAEKLERLQRLQAKIEAQGNAVSRSRLGSTQRLLVEGASRKDAAELMGRTECNRVVNFVASGALAGAMVSVRITEVRGHSLRGELVAA
jgi:tRNA-2-methylthio-N6-dimethylallyladenosine synthase